MKKFTYNGSHFQLDDQGQISSLESELKWFFNKKLNRAYYSWRDKHGKTHMTTAARLICTAWHGTPAPGMQCAHLDDNSTNDSPDNLAWMTRKENNSQPHARAMKSKNANATDRRDYVIKCTDLKTGEVDYFINGKVAAKALKCSHVLVYRVLNKTDYAKTAKGHLLEWVDLKELLNNK